MASPAHSAPVTLQATLWGIKLTVPLLSLEPTAAPSSSTAVSSSAAGSATAAPSAEVAELQRRLLATGDADVAILMTADPAQLDPLDARALARWLKAKGRDLDVAEEQILVHAHWRASYMPAGHIPEDSIPSELASEKVFLQGCDVHGRPVFIVFGKQQDQGRPEETKRFICYTLDNAIASADPVKNELGQFLCLFDLSGLSMKNLDVGALQAVFAVLQQHYPERLGELWFLNAPFIFWGLWRVVSPFIQQATKDKIKFVANKDKLQMLRQHIPEEVLPEVYGGEAELIPIEQAVQARLVREGMQRERIASNAAAAVAAAEAPEGRLTRAGRAVQRWASASADFVRRRNPVHAVAQSRSLARIKDWRPFNRGHKETLYLDQCTSAKSEDWVENDSSDKSEGRVGQLVMYLMPQVLFVAIFRKAQQAIQWAWSHAQRMKHSSDAQNIGISARNQTGNVQRAGPPESGISRRSRIQHESPVRRMSMSCQRYTAAVARRICQSVDGFEHVPSASLSPDGSPVSYRLLDDSHDTLADASVTDCFELSRREASRLQRVWRRQLFEDAQTAR